MNYIHEENKVTLFHDGSVIAEVTFPAVDDHTVDINRTFIDESMRGKGIAGEIMEETARQLRDSNKKAILSCSYAMKWFEKHKEYEEILFHK